MRNWCSKRYYHQRVPISKFLFFDIYYLFSINLTLSIFDFLSLFFYLVSFNSILQKVSKLGFMYKHDKNYSHAARLNGREHICVRNHRSGRGNPGSNHRRGQRIFFFTNARENFKVKNTAIWNKAFFKFFFFIIFLFSLYYDDCITPFLDRQRTS